MREHVLAEPGHGKARQDALEIHPVQHVELGERDFAGPHALHARLVLAAPGVGERQPIERMAERLEDRLRLARDRVAPVDQRAEHVEEQRFGHGRRPLGHESKSSRGPSEAREPGTHDHRRCQFRRSMFMVSGFAGCARAPE